MKRKIAIVTLGEERIEFFNKRREIVDEEINNLKTNLEKEYDVLVPPIIFSNRNVLDVIEALKRDLVNCIILHIPIWGNPSFASRFASMIPYPVLLLGNNRKDSSSIVSLLATAGMLEQAGKRCIRIVGDSSDPKIFETLRNYIESVNIISDLEKSHFGLIGGKSIGIGTTVADPAQIERIFGISFDHFDQFEIVDRCSYITEERVNNYMKWLGKSVNIEFGHNFNKLQLELQIKSYLAIKDMSEEYDLDFIGLKCQREMSDKFVLQCLGVALLNNDEDADGKKRVIPTSCESDIDGALTMKVLSLCNNNEPSSLVDIKYFESKTNEFILANCGSMAFYFDNPYNNKRNQGITIMPHVFGKAGGGAIQMVAYEGDVTVARFFRRNGKYVLCAFEGKMERKNLEELKETTWCYPHQFIKAEIDFEYFFNTINANHLHTVYGKHLEKLKLISDFLGIDFINYSKEKLI